jgi:hypothetical protein
VFGVRCSGYGADAQAVGVRINAFGRRGATPFVLVFPVGRGFVMAKTRDEMFVEILLELSPHLSWDPGVSTPVLIWFLWEPTPIIIAIDVTDTHLNALHD